MSIYWKNVHFFLSLLVFLAPNAVGQATLRPRGDVNCDWEVTVSDVNVLIDMVLSGTPYHALYTYAADLNQDKEINISDINTLIDYVLGGEPSPMPSISGSLPVLYIITEGHRDIISKEKKTICTPYGGLMRQDLTGLNLLVRSRIHLGCKSRAGGIIRGQLLTRNRSCSS